MKVFIGCSSYDDIDKKHFETAKKVSKCLIKNNYELVFGGSYKGLMGCVYNEFKKENKNIYAIQIEHYKSDLDGVVCNKRLVKDMATQLESFMNEADILLYLPGGYGTYNEIFYMICEYVNNSHNKKILIINIDHYYDELKVVIEKIMNEKFACKSDFIKFIDSYEELEGELC